MMKCLIALGTNLGDRAATLDAAIEAITTAGTVVAKSTWQLTFPIGLPSGQPEFLNGAVIVETAYPPAQLHAALQQIELQFGRSRHEHWASRTLDLDLLLIPGCVVDTPALRVPHPRMSFRRFMLEPAAEIAGDWVHPTIGWSLARLLEHLETGADSMAIVSTQESARRRLAARLAERFGCQIGGSQLDDGLWPLPWTTLVQVPVGGNRDGQPKLTLLLDPPDTSLAWEELVRSPGRGPTLQIPHDGQIELESHAAIEAVWPGVRAIGPAGE